MLYRSPDPLPMKFSKTGIFIAGGISDCPDWQQDVVDIIDNDYWDVVNPRRVGGFDRTGDTAEAQITWEHTALTMSTVYLFWFPKETLCPITLFEYGMALERAANRKIMVAAGWHEDYQRAFDLGVQSKLAKLSPQQLIYCGPGWDNYVEFVKNNFA